MYVEKEPIGYSRQAEIKRQAKRSGEVHMRVIMCAIARVHE